MENTTDYTKPLIVQDDCAPDAMQFFLSAFTQETGMTLQEYKRIALKIDVEEGYAAEWLLSRNGFVYCLSLEAGDPFYKLYKTKIA